MSRPYPSSDKKSTVTSLRLDRDLFEKIHGAAALMEMSPNAAVVEGVKLWAAKLFTEYSREDLRRLAFQLGLTTFKSTLVRLGIDNPGDEAHFTELVNEINQRPDTSDVDGTPEVAGVGYLAITTAEHAELLARRQGGIAGN